MSKHGRWAAGARALAAVVGAVVLIAVGSLFLSHTPAAQQGAGDPRAGDPATWRPVWDTMMTVFTHDRCLNCHGGTDPGEGNNHGGGPAGEVADFGCIGCHTANTKLVQGRCRLVQGLGFLLTLAGGVEEQGTCVPTDTAGEIRVATGPVWDRTGPDFVGKDALTLCLEVKRGMGPIRLIEHARADHLIGFAFEGRRAIDAGPFAPMDAEPPPMGQAEFVQLLDGWITEAAMACGTNGTITFEETQRAATPPGVMFQTMVRTATVAATVDIRLDRATADLRYEVLTRDVQEVVTPACTAHQDQEERFLAQGGAEATYEVNIEPGGAYTIRFEVPSIQGAFALTYNADFCGFARTTRTDPEQARSTPPVTWVISGQAERGTEPGILILKGSTTVPIDYTGVPGLVGGGERKLTWHITVD